MLAGRYRIVARLGRGGMGEVYRADDTRLGQPVALKFLRGDLSREFRERLYAEVRIGRQVSHPNVCRLYDVVEADGHDFCAMEYVDGEDLASLLGRIGRLPPDKALEITRDLCAGLAAVHERGVVHRDLKPANVMIDGRGAARITDFGLAVASQSAAGQASAGTPLYMAPEQLQGKEATERSDVFALGLIVYEMFTGRPFFEAKTLSELERLHRESASARLASAGRLLDPAVDRAMRLCLETDPASRPATARVVLAMLPGGDPLDAAVAAGETPSPEMVAAAATVGDLQPAQAWGALSLLLGGLLLAAQLSDRTTLIGRAPLPKPPDVLVERAREVLMRLGHATAMMDSAYSFGVDEAALSRLVRGPGGHDALKDARPGPWYFFYRQSPGRLIPGNRDGVVTRDDPPREWGMAEVELDPRGRLTAYTSVPPQLDPTSPPWREPDWRPLFAEAGLEVSGFEAAEPRWTSPVDSDHKAAWQGVLPGGAAVRIEAAAFHGRPVWFAIIPEWVEPRATPVAREQASSTPLAALTLALFGLLLPVGSAVLARRNLRLGRGDRKGAFRVGAFVFTTYALARIFRADHVASAADELWLMLKLLAYPALWGIQMSLLYVALEPYVRRRRPRVLVSWGRLLRGRFGDPLVGRDLLVGLCVGVVNTVFYRISWLTAGWTGRAIGPDTFIHGTTLTFERIVFFRLLVNVFSAVLFALAYLFALMLLRVILRRDVLAALAWVALVGTPLVGEDPVFGTVFGVMRGAVYLLTFAHCGLLGVTASLAVMYVLAEIPLSLDFGAWYAPRVLPVLVPMLGLAAYAFHTSLGGKPLFGRLDD